MRYQLGRRLVAFKLKRPFEFVGKKIVLHKKVLALSFAAAVVFFPPVTHAAVAPKISAQSVQQKPVIVRSASEAYYLNAVNKLRAEHNLLPLTIDSRLSTSATDKALDMVKNQYFSHWAPGGKSFSDFIWQDSPQAFTVGENLARCFKTRDAAFEALVASPTHFEIMTGQYTNFGVAETYDADSGCSITVMHFSFYKDKLYL